jgi:MOB kinase activator 1
VSKRSLRGKQLLESAKLFGPTVKNIFRRLLRVFAHIYYHHFEFIAKNKELEQDLHSTFKWFYYFAMAFELVDKKDFEPLQQLIDTFN